MARSRRIWPVSKPRLKSTGTPRSPRVVVSGTGSRAPLAWLSMYRSSSLAATVIPISALVMFRVPLMTSTEVPNGRLQPYLAAGPGLFISRMTGHFIEIGSRNISETSTEVSPTSAPMSVATWPI